MSTALPSLDERLVSSAIGTLELYAVYLGTRLGLYETLREHGPMTVAELAGTARIDDRYAREWLEQQAVAGLILVDNTDRDDAERRYSMSPEQVAALADRDDPSHVAPLADMLVGIGGVLDRVVDAFRSGDGVPYADYGPDMRRGQGGINRPALTHDLAGGWLAAFPDVHARLASGSPVRVAELGSGEGWASIALATAFPGAEIVGYDLDQASVDAARAHAAERGVTVRFENRDASAVTEDGPFDVILVVEALHDMARPVEVLAAARRALATGGSMIVIDERVADRFTAPGDELERFMFGWSVVHCLPASRAETPSAALGTVLRPETVEALAADAGFTTFEASDVDAGFFRLYRLAD